MQADMLFLFFSIISRFLFLGFLVLQKDILFEIFQCFRNRTLFGLQIAPVSRGITFASQIEKLHVLVIEVPALIGAVVFLYSGIVVHIKKTQSASILFLGCLLKDILFSRGFGSSIHTRTQQFTMIMSGIVQQTLALLQERKRQISDTIARSVLRTQAKGFLKICCIFSAAFEQSLSQLFTLQALSMFPLVYSKIKETISVGR